MTQPVVDVLRADATVQYATHHAAAVAAASIEKMLATAGPEETVILSNQLNKLQRSVLRSESAFLEAMWKMNEDDKTTTLFELFDKDGSQSVSSVEMARAFSKLDTKKSYRENLQTAAASIAAYDADDDGYMDIEEFKEFLEQLRVDLNCDFHALAHFLAYHVAFAHHGTAVLDEALVNLVQDSTATMSHSAHPHDVVMEVRMVLLFQLLDPQGTGKVDIAGVVNSLRDVTKFMDDVPRKALLMCEEDTSMVFAYSDFSSLLLNVQSASCLSFHEIANMMTIVLTSEPSGKTHLTNVFLENDITKMSKQSKSSTSNLQVDTILQHRRLTRLFDLWDLDHSGYIDFAELALGLRKYHDAKLIDDTLKESVAAMTSFDENEDQLLDQKEFASFLVQFAGAAHVSLPELIDFMLIEFVTKDNSDAECVEITDQVKALNDGSSRHGVGGIRGLWTSIRNPS